MGRRGTSRNASPLARVCAWLARALARRGAGVFAGRMAEDVEIDLGSDGFLMGEALRLARKAARLGEVPVGAVIAREGRILARAWNQVETLRDPTAHAEMLAITQAAAALGDWRLEGCDLFVTKEPCPMCAGAAVHARLRRVVFGLPDPKGGGAGGLVNLLQMPPLNHRCAITREVRREECEELFRGFFRELRRQKKEQAAGGTGGGASFADEELDGQGDAGDGGEASSDVRPTPQG